ncbi:MAG: hypothetical protein JWP04_617 [Belnapia sp.]|jgi:hypothetical protein|nr:hypothetical protein [Belnapia sp.]
MSSIRMCFLLFSAGLALLGLFTSAGAQDTPLAIFGGGVFLFGVAFGFSLIKRHYDEAEV